MIASLRTAWRCNPWSVAATGLSLLFVAAFLLIPLALMLWESLWHDGGFDTAPWRQLMAGDADWVQFGRSLQLGAAATGIATLIGAGHALLTWRTNLPLGRWLGPMGVLPLVMPPILVAMGLTDLVAVSGFWTCATIFGVAFAPFPAVLTARGLRSIDGRQYEAALLARGPGRAGLWLLRAIAPEILAGALFAFLMAVADHGVPEFLTVKGKNWLTYAEGIFSRWNLRTNLGDHVAVASATVASLPLVLLIGLVLALVLRLRGRATVPGDFRPLPIRRLGGWRWPALLGPFAYLGFGIGMPLFAMLRWAGGGTRYTSPLKLSALRERSWDELAEPLGEVPARIGESFRGAIYRAGDDLGFTTMVGGWTVLVGLLVAIPLVALAVRGRRWAEWLPMLAIAVPAILLGIGLIKTFNHRGLEPFYNGPGLLVAGLATRFLPFAVLTLAASVRRLPASMGESAQLTGRGALARGFRIHLPLWGGALWSLACLLFALSLRELDLCVVLPAGNDTIVRRLSNIVHFGGEEEGGALAILLLGIAVIVPIVTMLLTGRRMRSLS